MMPIRFKYSTNKIFKKITHQFKGVFRYSLVIKIFKITITFPIKPKAQIKICIILNGKIFVVASEEGSEKIKA